MKPLLDAMAALLGMLLFVAIGFFIAFAVHAAVETWGILIVGGAISILLFFLAFLVMAFAFS